jgi:peptide/nickel transport system substrate-binding protein
MEYDPGDGTCEVKTPNFQEGIGMRIRLAAILAFSICFLTISQSIAKSDTSNDELHKSYGDPPDLLNPLISQDVTSADLRRLTTESFARRRVQNPEEWELFLAEEWEKTETDDGKLIFDIKLREGVKWHRVAARTSSGDRVIEPVEFTSKDVVFSYRVVTNPDVRCPHIRSQYTDLESVKRRGKYQVRFTWAKKYFLAESRTLRFRIIPEHIFSMKEDGSPMPADPSSAEFATIFNGHWFNNRICGTGPYMLEVYEPNERAILVRNEGYWGEKPFYRKHVYHRIQEDTKAYLTLLKGELDIRGLNPRQYEEIQKRDEFKSGKIKVAAYDGSGYWYLGWNLIKPMFRDKRVRWAFAHATPRDKIIETILRNLATRNDGPFAINSNFYDKSISPIPYDPEEARRLLEEVGWTDTDGDGIREGNIEGKRILLEFTIFILQGLEDQRKVAEILRSEYGKIGARVEVTPLVSGQYLKILRESKYDAYMLGWSLGWEHDPYTTWHSSQIDEPESFNDVSYRNQEVDKLIETLRYTLDKKKQVELYHKIHRTIYSDQPYCFLWAGKRLIAYNARLSGVRFYSTINPGYDEREWSTVPGMERVK